MHSGEWPDCEIYASDLKEELEVLGGRLQISNIFELGLN